MKQHVARAIAFAVMMTVVVVSFQNCQDFSVSEEVLASEFRIQDHANRDAAALGKLMALDELVGVYISERAIYSGTTFSRVPNLHASLFAPGTVFNLVAQNPAKPPVPAADEARGRVFLTMAADSGGSNGLTTSGDTILSDEYTVFIVAKASSRGRVLSINSGGGNDLVQNVGFVMMSDSEVTATFSFNADHTYTVVGSIEPGTETVVIAVSFGIAADRIQLMVNGRLFEQGTAHGSPGLLAPTARDLVIGPWVNGNVLTWGEVRLFARRLGPYDLSVISRRMAADWQVNGVIDDVSLRTMENRSLVDFDEVEPVLDPRFAAAQAALDAKCATCHYHSQWAGKNALFYFSTARVIKGSPESSPIYYRLSASSAPALSGSKNMPQSPGPAMTPAEVEAIRDWIQNAP